MQHNHHYRVTLHCEWEGVTFYVPFDVHAPTREEAGRVAVDKARNEDHIVLGVHIIEGRLD